MKGFKTIILSFLVGGMATLEEMDYTNVITGENAPSIIIALAAIFGALRVITSTKIFQSEPQADGPIGGGGPKDPPKDPEGNG